MAKPGSLSRTAGFTLLEVLVVLLIMGLLVGLVSAMVLPDDRARLDVESQRLARLLALAGDEARLSGDAIAWTAEPGGYRFWQHDAESGWVAMGHNDLLRPRSLPTGLTVLGLRVENSAAVAPARLEFSANGSASAFTLVLGLGTARASVTGSPVGAITVLDDEARPDAIASAH